MATSSSSRRRTKMATRSRPESLAALISLYLEALACRAYSPRTIQNYESRLERFAAWCSDDGLTRAADVQLATFECYAEHLARRVRAPSSRKDVLLILRGLFRWLHRERHILQNPADGLVLRPIRRRLRAPLTHVQVEQLVESIDVTSAEGLRDRAVVEVLYSTAMRVSELCGLEVNDLDEQRGFIHIRHGKGRKDRWVPVGERAVLWVSRYLRESRPEILDGLSTLTLFNLRKLIATEQRIHIDTFDECLEECGKALASCELYGARAVPDELMCRPYE